MVAIPFISAHIDMHMAREQDRDRDFPSMDDEAMKNADESQKAAHEKDMSSSDSSREGQRARTEQDEE